MAKELYDGIYSSHKLIFVEKIRRNLEFYLKNKVRDIRLLGQEIFFNTDIDNLPEVLKEIRKNPEIEVDILSSINKYISKNRCILLINLSSVSNNFSMIIKASLKSPADDTETFAAEYNKLINQISAVYESAAFYLEGSKTEDRHFDIVLRSHILDGLDAFDTYLNAEEDIITKANISTRISVIPFYSITNKVTITELISKISRFDYNAGIFPELCFCLALEELMQLKVARRVQFIRMIISELSRISNHLSYIAKMATVLGSKITLSHILIEQERALRLIELVTGSRVHPNYIRVGGVRKDLNDEILKNISAGIKHLFKKIPIIESMLLDNTVITHKLKNTGQADRQAVLGCGVTGPNLRASGARYDLRKNRNLLLYREVSFLVAVGKYGDCLERLYIRFREIYQSIKIIDQLIGLMPDEHIRKLINLSELDMPYNKMVSSIECPHGVFKIYFEIEKNVVEKLVVMGPSRNSLYLAETILCGSRTEDIELILASLDISSGEIMQELPI